MPAPAKKKEVGCAYSFLHCKTRPTRQVNQLIQSSHVHFNSMCTSFSLSYYSSWGHIEALIYSPISKKKKNKLLIHQYCMTPARKEMFFCTIKHTALPIVLYCKQLHRSASVKYFGTEASHLVLFGSADVCPHSLANLAGMLLNFNIFTSQFQFSFMMLQ